jgi:hypothetical protein
MARLSAASPVATSMTPTCRGQSPRSRLESPVLERVGRRARRGWTAASFESGLRSGPRRAGNGAPPRYWRLRFLQLTTSHAPQDRHPRNTWPDATERVTHPRGASHRRLWAWCRRHAAVREFEDRSLASGRGQPTPRGRICWQSKPAVSPTTSSGRRSSNQASRRPAGLAVRRIETDIAVRWLKCAGPIIPSRRR